MLPALFFSLVFVAPAWWLWRRGQRTWAWVPAGCTVFLLLLTVLLQTDISNRTQARYDLGTLMDQLNEPSLYQINNLSNPDELLFLLGTASRVLHQAAADERVRRGAVDTTLYTMAAWVADRADLRQWKRNTDWDREVFFLAQAGAVLGHYQLVTGDLAFEGDFRAIGEHLGRRIPRGRYKHLLSRPGEEVFRPADNAAALYVVRLYDALYGTDLAPAAHDDWARYLTDELYYAESRLPCAAFSPTSRCALTPTASATGLYVAYRALADPDAAEDDIPWREWLHYFGQTSLSPFSMQVRPNMRTGATPRFCDQTAYPLDCNRYEEEIGMWAAAEYGASYTYFRLHATVVLRRWLYPALDYGALSPPRRTGALTRVALRACGEWR